MSTITKINVGGVDYDIGGSGGGGSGGTRIVTQGTKNSLQVNSPNYVANCPCGEGGVDLQFNRSSDDKTAKGAYSFVAGFDNKAAGNFSAAVGESNQALGKHSVATGRLCRNTIAGSVNNNNRNNQWMSSQFGGCGFKGFITTYTDATLFKLSNTDVLIARIDVLSDYSYPVSFFIEVQASEIVKLNTITVEGYDNTSPDFPVLMMLNGALNISRVANKQIGIFYTLYSNSNANSSSSSSSSGSGSSSSSSSSY